MDNEAIKINTLLQLDRGLAGLEFVVNLVRVVVSYVRTFDAVCEPIAALYSTCISVRNLCIYYYC